MLFNYRHSVHSTTNVTPTQLFFNRELKTFLPSINKKVKEIRKRQDEIYKKVKEYTDKRHANLMKGDKVLMLDNQKLRKLDSTYLRSWSTFAHAGLEKLGFLVHESPCFSKQVQENVVRLKILFTV